MSVQDEDKTTTIVNFLLTTFDSKSRHEFLEKIFLDAITKSDKELIEFLVMVAGFRPPLVKHQELQRLFKSSAIKFFYKHCLCFLNKEIYLNQKFFVLTKDGLGLMTSNNDIPCICSFDLDELIFSPEFTSLYTTQFELVRRNDRFILSATASLENSLPTYIL